MAPYFEYGIFDKQRKYIIRNGIVNKDFYVILARYPCLIESIF